MKERIRELFERSGLVMLLIEPDSGRIVDANETAASYYGYPIGTLVGLSIDQINTLSPEEVARERQHAVHQERNYFNFRHRLASGVIRNVEVYSSPIDVGGRKLLFSIIHDVTGRSDVENRLQQSEQRFRMLFDSSSDATWIMQEHRFIDGNRAAATLFGYPSGMTFSRVHPSDISPQYQPDGEASLTKAERMMEAADRLGLHRFEWVHKRLDGSEFDAEVTLSSIELAGRPALYAVARDITDRKQAERRDAAQSRLLEMVFQHSLSSLALLDRNFNFVRVNESYARADGRDVSEFPGHNHFEFYPSDAQVSFEEVVRTKAPFQAFARPFEYANHPERGKRLAVAP